MLSGLAPFFANGYFWHLPLIIVIVSLVYSATRHDDWKLIGVEAYRWGVRMVTFLGMIGLGLYVVTLFT
ncbi:MAG: hypothetical protein EXR99_00805 [Gemmataceae bacterium]|nr:hypothetical protein [Gemmataceae bacterium]